MTSDANSTKDEYLTSDANSTEDDFPNKRAKYAKHLK